MPDFISKKNNDVAILVHACDKYSLLFKGFEIFFNKNWDFSIPTNNYFATEEMDVKVQGFTNVKSGNGEWSDRLMKLLKEDIKEDYVIYLQEDMWLSKPVDYLFFKEVFDFAIANSVNCIKLHSTKAYKTKETSIQFKGLKLAQIDNENSSFLMSHQISLWKKDFLLNQLKKKENPWRNETRATERMKKTAPVLYQIDYFAKNRDGFFNNNNTDITNRSGYFTLSASSMLSSNVEHFFALLDGSEEERKYLQQIKYHYENKLTHDGKQKSQEWGRLKKIKSWIKRIIYR